MERNRHRKATGQDTKTKGTEKGKKEVTSGKSTR